MAWRFLDFQSRSIFENMAVDEAIFFETIKKNKKPTIRFYGSRPPAVSIGYFQNALGELNIEQCRRRGIDIARRITGGKAVFHINEITYSVAACEREKIFPGNISGTYRVISKCIARGLKSLGIAASLAEEGRARTNEDMRACCFSFPSKNELLVGGRKICGSAQARKSGGFLQHGLLLLTFDPRQVLELLLPAGSPGRVEELKQTITAVNEEISAPVDRQEICAGFRQAFESELGVRLEDGELTSAEEKLKTELMKKYTDDAWNIDRTKYFKAGQLL